MQASGGTRSDPVLGEILFEGAIAPCFMVRRGRFKYIHSAPDPDQIYDLESDPLELANLAGTPGYRDLQYEFQEMVLARWDSPALREQVIASQRRRRLVDRALAQGRATPWDFQPVRDASQQYMRSFMDLDTVERRARFPIPDTPSPDVAADGGR
jgi:choline-sulfatase